MTDYPPFSGDDPVCVKCGNQYALITYRPTGRCIDGDQVLDTMAGDPNERLCRSCTRCGYHWDEAVIPRAYLPRAAEETR